MRTRYVRYEEPERDPLRFTSTWPRGPRTSYVVTDDAAAGSSPSYERRRLEFPRPRVDPNDTALDLRDAVTDIENRLEALRDGGLGAVTAPLEEFVEDLRAVADFAAQTLGDFDKLYTEADQLTGDLDITLRENRRLVALEESMRALLQDREVTVAAGQHERRTYHALKKILWQAEKRGTVGRGTVKRWIIGAEADAALARHDD